MLECPPKNVGGGNIVNEMYRSKLQCIFWLFTYFGGFSFSPTRTKPHVQLLLLTTNNHLFKTRYSVSAPFSTSQNMLFYLRKQSEDLIMCSVLRWKCSNVHYCRTFWNIWEVKGRFRKMSNRVPQDKHRLFYAMLHRLFHRYTKIRT